METDVDFRPEPDSVRGDWHSDDGIARAVETSTEVDAPELPGDTVLWPSSPPVSTIRTHSDAAEDTGWSFGARFWRDACLGGLIVVMLHVFLIQVSVVRGLSMSPSLNEGDRLMVDRVSYALSEVARFDVVVMGYPRNPDVDFVKRVIGLPGDRVDLGHGQLQVNGEPLSEEFAHVADAQAVGSWTVPEGQYFVLGDNRPVSCDSREFGMVSHGLLKGKVRVCFWPLDRFTMF